MSAVFDVFDELQALNITKRASNESFKNVESRFTAQKAKFNAYYGSVHLLESIYALLLIHSTAVDDSDRFAILASVTSPTDGYAVVRLKFETTFLSYTEVLKYLQKALI